MSLKPPPSPYDPCPCGSGKKYKFCCRDKARREARDEALHEVMSAMGDMDESDRLAERGMQKLMDDDLAAAEDLFRRALEARGSNTLALSNLSTCRFSAGDLDAAVRYAERLMEVMGGEDDLGLSLLVRYYFLEGRDEEAAEAARRLMDIEASDELVVFRQAEAAGRLGRHEDVRRLVDEGMRAFPGERGILAFYAAAARLNLSETSGAERLLEEALDFRKDDRLASYYLGLLRKNRTPATLYVRWPYFEVNDWISPAWLLKIMKGKSGRLSKFGGWKHFIDSLLLMDQCDFGRDPEESALLAIDMLGYCNTDETAAVLRDMASGSFGTDRVRTAAAARLRKTGRISDSEPLHMQIQGRRRKVRMKKIMLWTGARGRAPAGVEDLYMRAAADMEQGDLLGAEKLGREIVKLAPEWAVGYHNLAVAILSRGGKKDEAEALLDRAIELDPSYVIARCTRARVFTHLGELEQAGALLDSIDPMTGVDHIEEMAAYQGARLELLLLKIAAFPQPPMDEFRDLKGKIRAAMDLLSQMKQSPMAETFRPQIEIARRLFEDDDEERGSGKGKKRRGGKKKRPS